MFFGVQFKGDRDHLPSFSGKRLFEHRMAGFPEHQAAVVRNDGHTGRIFHCRAGLRHYEVEFAYKLCRHEQIGHVGPQEVGKLYQYAFDFALFVAVQLLNLALQFHHLQRFHEGCLSGRRCVVHVAVDLAFAAGRHGDEVLAVADVDGGVGVCPTGILGGLEHRLSPFRKGSFGRPQTSAYLLQLR